MNLSSIVWTKELVVEWLEISSQVDRVLPPVGPRMAKLRIICAPTLEEKMWDEYNRTGDEVPPFRPTNEQMSIWEEVCLRWFPLISDQCDKKIVWLRSCGMGWARIAKRTNTERHIASANYKNAVEKLAKHLQSYYKNPQPDTPKRN